MGSTGWAQLVGLDGDEMGLAKRVQLNKLGSIVARWRQDWMGETSWAQWVGLDKLDLMAWARLVGQDGSKMGSVKQVG